MSRTKIEWCAPPGYVPETWNPETGCTPVSKGCINCYAERMARRLAGRYGYPEAPNHFKVTLHPDRMAEPLRWRKPRFCFVCSMGDLFHEDVPGRFINDPWCVMRNTPQHTYVVLTKRPARLLRWTETAANAKTWPIDEIWSDNIWLGVTAENQETADKRIPELLKIPAAVRFVSCEPLLGPIDLKPYLKDLDWVIVGGETGPGWRCFPEHEMEFTMRQRMNHWYYACIKSILIQCRDAGVPFFGKKAPGGGELPPDLKVRQWPRKRRKEKR